MRWSERELDGFALAALVRESPDSPAAYAVAPAAARQLDARRAGLAALGSRERRRWVREALRPEPLAAIQGQAGPPRALSLLATRVASELGREWLARAPLPRPGYVPPPSLLSALARLVARRQHGATTPERE